MVNKQSMPWGNKSKEGIVYEKAMEKLIWSVSFDINLYKIAVNNFKLGSSVNVGKDGKNGTGLYKNLPINPTLTTPLIKKIYPLIP